MKAVAITKTLNASAESVWKIIGPGTGVDKWFPMIKSCEMHGSGEGATRTCAMETGRLVERIETSDDQNMVFQYSFLEQPMPVSSLIGTWHVTPRSDGKCDFLWLMNFIPHDERAFTEIRKNMLAGIEVGLAGLEKAAAAAAR